MLQINWPKMLKLRPFVQIARKLKMSTQRKGKVSAYESVDVGHQNGIIADEIVDLRSDTVTKPCKGMREVMASAEVGDDVFEEDPTTKELETRVASILGKQQGLFITSGTMGNLISALVHCNERGSEMIVGSESHMFCYEQGNSAQLGGIHSCQIPNLPNGSYDIEGVIERIRSDDLHYPKTKLICAENTHNRCGGRIVPLEWLDELGNLSKETNIPLHMDGARIFNAGIGLGIPVSRIVRDFSSVSVCFSKGLGAPVGSVVVGDTDFIFKARRMRKAMGGAMRQCGVLAAAGMYSLDHMIDRLKDDHDNAKIMTQIINEIKSPHVFVNSAQVETNIFMLNVVGIDVVNFCKRLSTVEKYEKDEIGALVSVKCLPWSDSKIRLVTHADVSQDMAIKAAEKISLVAKEFAEKSK